MERSKNKQPKLHLRKGDLVEVIAGNDKGKRGTILSVDLKNLRAVVEGVNMVKKHLKPSAKNPEGAIVEREASLHISNLMVVDPETDQPRRSKRIKDENGKMVRVFKTHTSLKDK